MIIAELSGRWRQSPIVLDGEGQSLGTKDTLSIGPLDTQWRHVFINPDVLISEKRSFNSKTCFIISYPILLQSAKSVLHAFCTQLWKLFSAAPQRNSLGIWREVKTTFRTCRVLTQVYVDREDILSLKTRKNRKWCCPGPAEAGNGSLGLRNS